jgi:hypothetical protein
MIAYHRFMAWINAKRTTVVTVVEQIGLAAK